MIKTLILLGVLSVLFGSSYSYHYNKGTVATSANGSLDLSYNTFPDMPDHPYYYVYNYKYNNAQWSQNEGFASVCCTMAVSEPTQEPLLKNRCGLVQTWCPKASCTNPSEFSARAEPYVISGTTLSKDSPNVYETSRNLLTAGQYLLVLWINKGMQNSVGLPDDPSFKFALDVTCYSKFLNSGFPVSGSNIDLSSWSKLQFVHGIWPTPAPTPAPNPAPNPAPVEEPAPTEASPEVEDPSGNPASVNVTYGHPIKFRNSKQIKLLLSVPL